MDNAIMEGELTAIDIDGTRKALKPLEVNESFETLGVQLNPIGDDTETMGKELVTTTQEKHTEGP
jgi:hypothetical protein